MVEKFWLMDRFMLRFSSCLLKNFTKFKFTNSSIYILKSAKSHSYTIPIIHLSFSLKKSFKLIVLNLQVIFNMYQLVITFNLIITKQ